MSRIQFINSLSQKATASEQEGSGPHPEHRETVSLIQEQFLQPPQPPPPPPVHIHHNSSSNPKGGSQVNQAKLAQFISKEPIPSAVPAPVLSSGNP